MYISKHNNTDGKKTETWPRGRGIAINRKMMPGTHKEGYTMKNQRHHRKRKTHTKHTTHTNQHSCATSTKNAGCLPPPTRRSPPTGKHALLRKNKKCP